MTRMARCPKGAVVAHILGVTHSCLMGCQSCSIREFMPGTIKLTTLVLDPRREPILKTEITSTCIIYTPLQPHISVLHIPHQ